jgi:hypothetical protein
MALPTWPAGALAAGLLLGVACTGPYPMADDTGPSATSTGGDCEIGSEGCMCTAGGTCDPGLVCASKKCVRIDDTTGPDTSTGPEPTTSGSSTAGPECDPGGDGAVDPACPEGQPYCLSGECVDCGDLQCESVFPNLPLCDPSTGQCVTCLCDDQTPVCDPETHTCSKCEAHPDCPQSACDLWTGACVPADAGLWVDGEGACDDAGAGTEDDPLCTLTEAFARIQASTGDTHAVRVRPGSYGVVGPLTVPEGDKVALVHATGADADAAVRVSATGVAILAVGAGGALLIDKIELGDAAGDGMSCSEAQMWLDRLRVVDAANHGIRAQSCEVTLRRSAVVGSGLAGALLQAGTAHVENSFFSANGNTTSGKGGGVYLEGGAVLDAVYTSFIRNVATAGTPYAVACDEDPGFEEANVRNSVAINKGFNTLCEEAVVKTTAWSHDPPGATNINVPEAMLADLLEEDGSLTGVYRVIPGGVLDELAMWQDGDPPVDFDGDPRPDGDSSPDFAGADRAPR